MKKEEIFNLIKQNTCTIIPELENHNFQAKDQFKDLGANSIDRAEIIMMTMEQLSLQIPRVEVFGTKNIGELVDLLHEKSGS
jgi:polyketide biosynthesis acyl carrier protein